MSGYYAESMDEEEMIKFYEEFQRKQLVKSFEEYVEKKRNKETPQS